MSKSILLLLIKAEHELCYELPSKKIQISPFIYLAGGYKEFKSLRNPVW